jgi:hypothetical protein
MFKKKWKLVMFYNGTKIKTINIDKLEDINTRYVRIFNHKELFGSRLVGRVLKPVKLLKTDEKAMKTYWGVIDEKGVDM